MFVLFRVSLQAILTTVLCTVALSARHFARTLVVREPTRTVQTTEAVLLDVLCHSESEHQDADNVVLSITSWAIRVDVEVVSVRIALFS